ncbi:MAG: OsmC family protein [Saprospiraceae bacterium]|jgi:putative redox protein|nr:OsmC family protein [Saprospiraceae bacterium]MBP6448498.1 OsmC family protein [Saprospiraceae bacterium]
MTSKIIYTGDLRTECTHLRSGQTIITDAPVDNNGKGEAFSPTDLAATSLGSCMITIMGISARNHKIDIDGATLEVTKHMASDPRRISGIDIKVNMPQISYTSKEKKILEKAGRTCPVAFSLHPDIIQNIEFVWYD